ncbi:superoxide dismutase family protein Rsod [Lycorma delicatula]|uniref:superoxide dismutase family protein Rsod n=1 Tax=Lycorma delicatula TaxID=130591 RepID=UPI003F511F13
MLIPGAFILTLCVATFVHSLHLSARFSENGLEGEIIFIQDRGNETVYIHTDLVTYASADDTQLSWGWTVQQFPVDYTQIKDRCDDKNLGKLLVTLDSVVGPLTVNTSADLSGSIDVIPLVGPHGLWGRSLLLKSSSGLRACATLTPAGSTNLKVAEARFNGPVAGSVYFQWVGSTKIEGTDALIYTDLYHTKPRTPTTQHHWKIFTTDILDSESDKSRRDCDFLQVVYSPNSKGSGELSDRLGSVSVGAKEMFRDPDLLLPDLNNKQRNLYLVIFDNRHPEVYLACSRLTQLQPVLLRAMINSQGLKGNLTMEQASPFSPTAVVFNWTLTGSTREVIGGFRIHEMPAVPPVGRTTKITHCVGIGNVYNPTQQAVGAESLYPASATQEKYAVGDLSGKLGYNGEKMWDVFLPLRREYSVAHRSLVIYRNGDGSEVPWVCSTLINYQTGANINQKVPMNTAQVIYRYPLAGRILMRQVAEDWTADTAILIEQLVHADGTSVNNTHDHRWGITENPPGKDFYNWTARCVSAGSTYDPYFVYIVNKTSDSQCGEGVRVGYCRVGALSERLGKLSIAGRKSHNLVITRKLFNDPHTPLSGPNSVIGRSFVIYADNGPKARGDRLACSRITSVFRRKAVVHEWFGNGIMSPVSGKMEFYQQTEYDVVDMEFNIENLDSISSYRIHQMPVQEQLEFPCEQSALNSEYDPFGILLKGSVPPPGVGTSDMYPIGDLSGKFGLLDNRTSLQETAFNDSSMQLFGQQNILGRSVVLHKSDGIRWTCGTIERGYAPSEARELRAIASFHHPFGFAWGYIKMTQLIHSDGSPSDTVIEVTLRHPGKTDRNVTRNHNWAIYVNPVSVDATVKIQDTRCTAGGYIWNPYFTQLADPLNGELYRQECGPDHPLRCYVGDVSGRLGPIDLGGKRSVFSDPNFPLEGDVSALGRSIVILDKDFGSRRFACANIEPDKDIIKYVNIRKTPKFIVTSFIEEIHEVMGIPEWFLTIDNRKTKILNGGVCIQLYLHFKGPAANNLEQDFSRLLSTGKLESPSIYIPGYVPSSKRKSKIQYKLCGGDIESGKKLLKSYSFSAGSVHGSNWLMMLLFSVNMMIITT